MMSWRSTFLSRLSSSSRALNPAAVIGIFSMVFSRPKWAKNPCPAGLGAECQVQDIDNAEFFVNLRLSSLGRVRLQGRDFKGAGPERLDRLRRPPGARHGGVVGNLQGQRRPPDGRGVLQGPRSIGGVED